MQTRPRKSDSLSEKLGKYGLAVGAAAAATAGMGTEASGAIVVFDIADQTISPGGLGIWFDLEDGSFTRTNGGPAIGEDFFLGIRSQFYGVDPYAYTIAANNENYVAVGPTQTPSGYSLARRLSAGYPIDGSLTFGADYVYLRYTDPDSNYFGEWDPDDTTAYLGLRIVRSGPSTFFGWAEVTFEMDEELTLHRFAYENTGAAIDAGQIPEPSSAFLLALGSAGLGLLRNRRKRSES